MKISVIGCGRWGSFIAWYLSGIGHEVLLCGRPGSARLARLRESRTNGLVTLPAQMELTDDLRRAVCFGEVIVLSVGAQGLRGLLGGLAALPVDGRTLVLCMKGIEASTGKRLTEIVTDELGARVHTAIWVGPGHVQDFTAGIPNCMVIDSAEEQVRQRLVEEFSSELIRFYYGTDLIGNEVGAAAKNVIGIAAGMLDGLGVSSLKGALMSRGTREIARLIAALGGKEESAYGLAHLGDYEATLFSPHSHNRRFGEAFVTGAGYTELAEGEATVTALLKLAAQHGVELPICLAVDRVIHQGVEPREALGALFLRSLKREF